MESPSNEAAHNDSSVAEGEENETVLFAGGSDNAHVLCDSKSDSCVSTEPTTKLTNESSGFYSGTGGGEKSIEQKESSFDVPSPSGSRRRSAKSTPKRHVIRAARQTSTTQSTILSSSASTGKSRENDEAYSSNHHATESVVVNKVAVTRGHHFRKGRQAKEEKIIPVKVAENNSVRCSPKSRRGDLDYLTSRYCTTNFTTTSNYQKAEHKPPMAIISASGGSAAGFTDKSNHHHNHAVRKWFSPTDIIENYGTAMTGYECEEILKYRKIWYFVLGPRRVVEKGQHFNYGFDNRKGEYKTHPYDHIAYRYEVINTIGKGAFGEVVLAYDHREQRKVALKIISNRPNLHEQAKVEVDVLKTLERRDSTGNKYTLRIFDDFVFRNHPCIVCELLGENLYQVLKRGGFRGLQDKFIRNVTRCMLKSLAILKKEAIVHCDIKPENILLVPGEKNRVKLIDFGSSCRQSEQIYNYIQSRYYRAPEVILGMRYSVLIDMWSLGCVLAELHTGRPLFPGASETDQLQKIARLLGDPPLEMLEKSPSFSKLLEEGTHYLPKFTSAPPKSFEEAVGVTDPLFKDFVLKCLTWKPEDRMTVDEALKHPWVKHIKSRKQKYEAVGIANRNRAFFDEAVVNVAEVGARVSRKGTFSLQDSGVSLEWFKQTDTKLREPRSQKV